MLVFTTSFHSSMYLLGDYLHSSQRVMLVSVQSLRMLHCRTIAPDRSPFGSKDCIYVPRTNWEGGNTYYIVNSDTVSPSTTGRLAGVLSLPEQPSFWASLPKEVTRHAGHGAWPHQAIACMSESNNGVWH